MREEHTKKEKKINLDNIETDGLKSEDFDINKPIEQLEQTEDLENKEKIVVEYDMNGAEVTQALKKFHRMTLYKKNVIYTAILLFIFFAYMARLIKNPEDGLAIFLSVVSIAVVGLVWFMPAKHIKATAAAVDAEEMRFKISLYDTCAVVGEGENQVVLNYTMPKIVAFETELVFGLGLGKERVFLMPKRCCAEQAEQIRAVLKTAFGEKYSSDVPLHN